MAGVGAIPAYAVSVAPTWQNYVKVVLLGLSSYNLLQTFVIAVQKVFYNQRPTLACEF